jgi:hypothetical protein
MSSNASRRRLIASPGGDLAKIIDWATRLPKLTTTGKYLWQSDIFVSNVGSSYLSWLQPRNKQWSQQRDEASLWGSVLEVAPRCKMVPSEVVRRLTARHWPVRRRLVPVCEKRTANRWQVETDLFIKWALAIICKQSVQEWVVAGSWMLRSVERGSRTHSALHPANTINHFNRGSTSTEVLKTGKHKLETSKWTALRCFGHLATFSVRTSCKEIGLIRRCRGRYGRLVRPN